MIVQELLNAFAGFGNDKIFIQTSDGVIHQIIAVVREGGQLRLIPAEAPIEPKMIIKLD
jgi:hypothetical protein